MQFNDKKETIQPIINTIQHTIQQSVTTHIEDRISKLEKEIKEIKRIRMKNLLMN